MGYVRKIVLRTLWGGLLGFVLGGAALPPAAGAEPPQVVCFLYADSVAAAVDARSLITAARWERLDDGYPLSFELQLSLFRRVPVWFDERQAAAGLHWRIFRRRLDGRLQVDLHSSRGRRWTHQCETAEELVRALDAQLTVLLCPRRDLTARGRYFAKAELSYRTLSFDDVVAADRWLTEGRAPRESAAAERSTGQAALGLLWDLAGLRPEKEIGESETFRPEELRTVEPPAR